MGIIGLDEVGRGAWAGPLVFAAVSLIDSKIENLNDSKKLSSHVREKLNRFILDASIWEIVSIESQEVDELGLTLASEKACTLLLDKLSKCIEIKSVILDGSVNYLKHSKYINNVKTVIKADNIYRDVMAASIIAKIYRDNIMKELDLSYPGYGFASNVGYGTKSHIQGLEKLGPTPIHRMSYAPLRRYL